MTLLEILAQYMTKWPAGFGRVIQDDSGAVLACAGFGERYPFLQLPVIATDRATAVATEPKWQAQRAQAQQKGPAS